MQNNYREYAGVARAEAEAATLANVRDRCLRAAAAWTAMAERQDRVDRARVQNLDRKQSIEQQELHETHPIETD